MADHCRPSGGCRGFLGSVVSKQLHSVLPPNAPKLCSGRLYAAVTAAKPDGLPDPHMLLGSTWQDKEQLVSAVSASCYLPALSGPSATTTLHGKPEAGAVYDGGFSYRLPCPPGRQLTWATSRTHLYALADLNQHVMPYISVSRVNPTDCAGCQVHQYMPWPCVPLL